MTGCDCLKNFLQEEGFRYTEEERYISFKYEGTTYFAFKADSIFLQIVLVCNTEKYDKYKILETCNELNSDKYVVKFVLREDNTVWCNYEFIPSEYTPAANFEMALSLMNQTSDELFARLSK